MLIFVLYPLFDFGVSTLVTIVIPLPLIFPRLDDEKRTNGDGDEAAVGDGSKSSVAGEA